MPLALSLAPALAAVLAVVMVLAGWNLEGDDANGATASMLITLGLSGLAVAFWLALWLERNVNGPLAAMAGRGTDGSCSASVIAVVGARLAAAERARSEAELDRDRLTGMGGTGWLLRVGDAAIESARRDGRRLALVLVDLDRFGEVNGLHGCRIGDEALRRVARRLADPLRGRSIAARAGGDRFAVLRDDLADEAAADAWSRSLLDSLAQPMLIDGVGIELSASAGVAMFPDHGIALEPLLRSAEMAVGEVKRAGGGRARIFCRRMDASLKARKSLERELRHAIDNGDFRLHYQPQIDLRTGRTRGVEALLRWPHRSQGMIPPATFIPLAESCGLIRPLGAWVMGEACRAGRRWRDLGLPIEIAVNLSAAQLRHQELATLVGRTLADTGLPADALELELTESLFVDPSEIQLRRALERVAEMGVQLAIDDFGTGYSSLAYLKRLPFSKIKIDRSFLVDIGNERVDEAIVRAIIGLAKTFGKLVLAEGVETEAQRQFLLREDCDAAQGYLFSRPVAEEAITTLLQADARHRAAPLGFLARAS